MGDFSHSVLHNRSLSMLRYIKFAWMTGWMNVCVCIDGWIDVVMDGWMVGLVGV